MKLNYSSVKSYLRTLKVRQKRVAGGETARCVALPESAPALPLLVVSSIGQIPFN
jgi:hypothetical protein